MATNASPDRGLSAAVGAGLIANGSPDFAVDGLVPDAVARPVDYAGVQGTLRFASNHGLAVIPLGGRRHTSLGNTPARYNLALDLSGLDSIVEFEPADLTITVQAGVTLERLRKVAAAAGLVIPFDPSAPPTATVGGMIAAAVDGPARMSLGTPRDFTIGLKVVTADGRLTRAGGKVVKNVAGYDLCKLYTGSIGTLGVIVEASLKALPAPRAEHVLVLPPLPAGEACRIVRSAARMGLSIRSAVLRFTSGGWQPKITLAGTQAGVDRSAREIRKLAGQPFDEGTGELPPPNDRSLIVRIAVLPTVLASLLDELHRTFPHAIIEAWPASGVALLGIEGPAGDQIDSGRTISARHDGTFTVVRCPPELKHSQDVFGDEPEATEVMRGIKREFDPAGTLSPGRGVGFI